MAFDNTRVDALFAGSAPVMASELLADGVTVAADGEEGGDVVLMEYRLRAGRAVEEYRSEGPPYPGGLGGALITTELGTFYGNTMAFADWGRAGLPEGEAGTSTYLREPEEDGDLIAYFVDPPPGDAMYFPEELSMEGLDGGKRGWLEFRLGRVDSDLEPETDVTGPWGNQPAVVIVYGTARGGIQYDDGESSEVAPTPAMLVLNSVSPTEARGRLVSVAAISAWFRIGHMYCSTAPRALDVDLAEDFDERVFSLGDQLDQSAARGGCWEEGN